MDPSFLQHMVMNPSWKRVILIDISRGYIFLNLIQHYTYWNLKISKPFIEVLDFEMSICCHPSHPHFFGAEREKADFVNPTGKIIMNFFIPQL